MTPEQTAADVGLLALQNAFQGTATFSCQEVTADSIIGMIIYLNLPVSLLDKPSFKKSYLTASGGKYNPFAESEQGSKLLPKETAGFSIIPLIM